MILTGSAIAKAAASRDIVIEPFDENHVNPNSYDLRLGPHLVRYVGGELDTRKQNETEAFELPSEGYVLRGGAFYLGHSAESVGSDNYVPMLHSKSGIARLGLFIHVTADLIDIGSHGQLTFQLHPTVDVKVYPGMRIGQVSFWKPQGEISLYSGKYQGSRGPIASRSFQTEGAEER